MSLGELLRTKSSEYELLLSGMPSVPLWARSTSSPARYRPSLGSYAAAIDGEWSEEADA